jgi:hypothetical protein
VYDTIGSQILQQQVWFTLDSGMLTPATYRGRNFVWCYDQWTCEDPTSAIIGTTSGAVSTHYGATIGWEFGTPLIYNEGNDAIVLEMELVGLPGRVPLGADPVVWTSHSVDGETWSRERAVQRGQAGRAHEALRLAQPGAHPPLPHAEVPRHERCAPVGDQPGDEGRAAADEARRWLTRT